MNNKESEANKATETALHAIQRAHDLCALAGYGGLVLGPLLDAKCEVQYALDTALGRN